MKRRPPGFSLLSRSQLIFVVVFVFSSPRAHLFTISSTILHHPPPSSTILHHPPPSSITHHPNPSPSTSKYSPPSSRTYSHHLPSTLPPPYPTTLILPGRQQSLLLFLSPSTFPFPHARPG